MAKSVQHAGHKVFDDNSEFVIITPPRHQPPVPIDGAGTIRVAITDMNASPAGTYQATLFSFPFVAAAPVILGQKDPLGNDVDSVLLLREGATNVWSARMDAHSPDETGTGPNLVIQVDDLSTSDSQRFSFRAQHNISGSFGLKKQFQIKFCRPGQLVPVALTLKLDSKVTKGTCAKCAELNQPTLLLHSEEAKLDGCWFSRPIAFCGKGAAPGYWMLERNSATAWTLVLKQGDEVNVTFTAKTKPKDCSLPIQLEREGAGSKVCKDWPKTVTISPAS